MGIKDFRTALFCAIAVMSTVISPLEALAAGTWTPIGPWGGDIRGIAVDPSDSSVLYAVTYGSGVFKSSDGGDNWTQSGLSSARLTAVAADPVTSDVLYTGTADGKMYRSTNGGANWSAINSGLPSAAEGKVIKAIAVDSSTTDVLYIGTEEDGIYKSSNAGTSWSAANAGLGNWNVEALAIDPSNTSILYAGTYNGGIFKSADGGGNWSSLGTGPTAIRSLAIDPQTPATVYTGTSGGGVSKSSDSGTSWSAVNTGLPGTPTVEGVVVAPDTSHTAYAVGTMGLYKSTDGGANWGVANSGMESTVYYEIALAPGTTGTLYAASRDTPLYRTTDSAANWVKASTGLWCWDFRTIDLDPANTAIYAGDYGVGVLKSSDSGASWAKANNGLTTTVQILVVDTANSYIYAGTFNGIFKSVDGAANWSAINSGLSGLDTDVIAVDPHNSDRLLAVTTGGLHRSTNGGTNWVGIGGGITGGTISSIAFNPGVSGNIFVSTYGGGIFESSDGGDTWSARNSGLGTLQIDTVAISPANTDTLYAGTWTGMAYRSVDGGANWSESSGGMDTLYLYDLIPHPGDADTAYAGTSDGVFKTTDAGGIWTEMNVGLAELSIKDIDMDPATPNVIYAVGLHSSVQKLELAADLRLPGAIAFGAIEVNTSSTPQLITLENAGTASLAVSNIALTGTAAAQYSLDLNGGGSPCAGTTPTIVAGGSCTVSVTYSPTNGGSHSAALSVTSDDPQKSVMAVTLSGIGTIPAEPAIYVSPSSINFGTVANGTDSTPEYVEISNWGNAMLTVSDLQITGTDAAEFSLDIYDGGYYYPCGYYLPYIDVYDACAVAVTFSPSSVGTKSAALTITSDDPSTPTSDVNLSGVSGLPAISLDTTSLDFGSAAGAKAVTVTNNGNASLTIGTIADSNPLAAPFSITSDTCSGQIIAPASNCTITVAFNPATAVAVFVGGMGLAGLMLFGITALGQERGWRRNQLLTALLFVWVLSMITSCSGGGGGGGGGGIQPIIYTDSFDIPSDDPSNPTVTVSVQGSS